MACWQTQIPLFVDGVCLVGRVLCERADGRSPFGSARELGPTPQPNAAAATSDEVQCWLDINLSMLMNSWVSGCAFRATAAVVFEAVSFVLQFVHLLRCCLQLSALLCPLCTAVC